jgi:hypothetical protein
MHFTRDSLNPQSIYALFLCALCFCVFVFDKLPKPSDPSFFWPCSRSLVRVASKDLASKSIPRYDDAKGKLGAILTAPTLFQRLAKHFQDVAREFGKLVEKQQSWTIA